MKTENSKVFALLKKSYKATTQGSYPKVEWLSTGLLGLDLALGGGLPSGRIIELFGSSSCGKTTLALQCMKIQQRLGRLCVVVDAEQSMHEGDLIRLGLNGPGTEDNPIILVPVGCGEDAVGVILDVCKVTENAFFLLDSVAMCRPESKMEDTDLRKADVASLAKFMGDNMQRLNNAMFSSNSVLILINQVRTDMSKYGGPEKTTGGAAVGFTCSQRVRVSSPKTDSKVTSNMVTVKVVKNKVAVPYQKCELTVYFSADGERTAGYDELGSLVDAAIGTYVTRAGAWYSFSADYLSELGLEPNVDGGAYRVGSGSDSVKEFLKENKSVHEKLYSLMVSGHKPNLEEIEAEDEETLAA